MEKTVTAKNLLDWILAERENQTSPTKTSGTPFIVGISAPQGAGKTTLTNEICRLAATRSLSAIAISIDDFYLPRTEQVKLSNRYPGNPYLQHRGYPLTHDIELGRQTLEDICARRAAEIPRYDKSAHEGKGDRFPREKWTRFVHRPDIILFEGWMLGFEKVPESQLPNSNFKVINEALPNYDAWTSRLDAFIWFEPNRILDIVEWRIEAEEKMRASGKRGMSNAEARAYIESFIPAYETYLPTVGNALQLNRDAFLKLKVQRDRSLVQA